MPTRIKLIKVTVELFDGKVTSWIESSRLKDPCPKINNRVLNQLNGLNVREVATELVHK